MKVKLFANYDSSENLLKRFKNNYQTDDEVEFTINEDYDIAVVFNKTDETIKPEAKVITVVQEPSWSSVYIGNKFLTNSNLLVIHNKEVFEKRFKIKLGNNAFELPSYMWYNDHVSKDFFENTDKVKKKKKLSIIVSSIYMSIGNYKKRIELVNKIIKSDLDIDIFGTQITE